MRINQNYHSLNSNYVSNILKDMWQTSLELDDRGLGTRSRMSQYWNKTFTVACLPRPPLPIQAFGPAWEDRSVSFGFTLQ